MRDRPRPDHVAGVCSGDCSVIARVGHAEDDTYLGFSVWQRRGSLKGTMKDTVICSIYLVVFELRANP